MFTDKANKIFQDVIDVYHVINTVDQPFKNIYNKDTQTLEHLLYRKCWIERKTQQSIQKVQLGVSIDCLFLH